MLIAFVCSMFTDGHPPPASKQAVKDLPTVKTSAEQQGCFLLHFRYCFYLLIYIYIYIYIYCVHLMDTSYMMELQI